MVSLLAGEEVSGAFGLGEVRTREAYECYAGLNFRLRRIQDGTRLGLAPPNAGVEPDWASRIHPWIVRVMVTPAEISDGVFRTDGFWMVTIEDGHHQEMFRQDFSEKDLAALTGSEPLIALICEFESGLIPAYWTVWPYSREGGWGIRVSGKLPEQDFAIVVS